VPKRLRLSAIGLPAELAGKTSPSGRPPSRPAGAAAGVRRRCGCNCSPDSCCRRGTAPKRPKRTQAGDVVGALLVEQRCRTSWTWRHLLAGRLHRSFENLSSSRRPAAFQGIEPSSMWFECNSRAAVYPSLRMSWKDGLEHAVDQGLMTSCRRAETVPKGALRSSCRSARRGWWRRSTDADAFSPAP